jgi:hypothetical protein
LVLSLVLPLGCAAQYEEPAGAQPDDSAREQVSAAEPEPAPAAMDMQAADRSLGDIEPELASNEAKLRALGVALPSRVVTNGDATLGTELAPAPKPEPARPGGGGVAPRPDARPSAAPTKSETNNAGKGAGSASTKQERKQPSKKAKDKDTDESDRFANPPPEQAKATPLSPTEQPQLDAATRCIQVCELSEISCELGVQICELAQRHAGDQDYEQACARATEDCDAAQEACDVCAG